MKPVKLFGWMFRLMRLLFASTLLIMFITPSLALAQSTDDPWTTPVNLSHSGVGANPAIVSDSEGIVHVVWQNNLQEFIYARLDGAQWTSPEITDLDRLFTVPVAGEPTRRGAPPWIYTGPNPLFIAGPDRYIFAFWISPQGRLFTSRVRNTNFDRTSSWEAEGVIANQAASFAVSIDASGEWHLAYFRTAADILHPAGIYYTHSRNGGLGWALPVLLYQSPYLGHLDVGEANLSIATTNAEGAQHVYIAWDNRPRKQVFLVHSADGGKDWDWEKPMLVAGPSPASGSAGPLNIQVGANQNNVVLVWQSGRITNGSLSTCSQIYRSSTDAGSTWSDSQPMIENMLNCSQSNKFVTRLSNNPQDRLYYLTETKSQVFLTAWNGSQWSQSQEQPILSGFEEPEIYSQVIYGCHQTAFLGTRLYVVGCDLGDGGDIWVTSRDLGADKSSFQPPVWSQLSPVSSESFKMEAIRLVSTDDGSFHAFFSQNLDRAIYYTYWNGESWSHINPVLKLPEGETASPAVAAGPNNELLLIAGSNNGTVYFSRANSGDAATESSWSTATQLKIGHDGEIGSTDIATDPAGTIYVVYSVPVNQDRGIYLVQSKDHGASWSEPLQVFKGADVGFDLVGAPSLLISSNGVLHITWKEQSIEGDGGPQTRALFYTRSGDGGHTFSEATPVVKEPVAWQEMLSDGKGNLHLFWQPQNALKTVWDQISPDGGITWQYPQGLPDIGKFAAVTKDSVGGLHLVGAGPDALGHWLWNGHSWQSETPLSWPSVSQQQSQNPVGLLAAAVSKQGKMLVLVAEQTIQDDVLKMTLHYATRKLKLPSAQSTSQQVSTKAPLTPTSGPATSTPAPLLTPTATADNLSATEEQSAPVETNGQASTFTTVLLPVGLLLLSVLGIAIWQVTRAKDR